MTEKYIFGGLAGGIGIQAVVEAELGNNDDII